VSYVRVIAWQILFVIVFGSSALADGPGRRLGLSQTDFDEAILKPVSTLNLKSVTVESKPKVETPSAVRARLKPALGEQFRSSRLIVPQLTKALQSNSRLTTESRWSPTLGGSCTEKLSLASLCQKAKTLKELLARYTGDNHFYDGECSETCAPGRRLALHSLTISSARGGDFTISSDEKGCFYQLEKELEQSWVVLEAADTGCACLPNACLN